MNHLLILKYMDKFTFRTTCQLTLTLLSKFVYILLFLGSLADYSPRCSIGLKLFLPTKTNDKLPDVIANITKFPTYFFNLN